MEKKDTILVSCYYLIKSKPGRTHELYRQWYSNMLECLTCPLIVFTDEKSKEYLTEKKENPLVKFIILPFDELYFYKGNYGLDFWLNQEKIDPNHQRSWQVSLLYNEKCHFVERVLTMYPEYKWYIWIDIGLFRQKMKDMKFAYANHCNEDKMTLLQINQRKPFMDENYVFKAANNVFLGGGVQVATKKIWNEWILLYNEMFKYYTTNGTVNCDQGLLASIALRNPKLVELIPTIKVKSLNYDEWFYMLEYLSEDTFLDKTCPITILIPLYNGSEYLEECLISVINQTFKHWKILIGINGHKPNSEIVIDIAKRVSSLNEGKRITLKHYLNTKGKVETMNIMAMESNTPLLAILDIDDKWLPLKLETQMKYIGDYDVIGTNCTYFGEKTGSPTIPFGFINNTHNFLKCNPIINSSAIIKREFGVWNDRFGLDDYDMWLRLRKENKKFYNISDKLVLHRIHKDSYFNSSGRQNLNGLLKYYNNIL